MERSLLMDVSALIIQVAIFGVLAVVVLGAIQRLLDAYKDKK